MSSEKPAKPEDRHAQERPSSPNPKNEPGTLGDDRIREVHAALQREKQEPDELAAPMPLSIVLISCLVIAWAAFYFGKRYNNFSTMIYDPYYDPAAASTGPVEVDMVALGKRLYSANCLQCHQADGGGVAGNFPPLAGSPWVLGTADRSISILLFGLMGEIEVLGNTYNGNMPAFGSLQSDRNIAAILTYVRQEWGNTGTPVTPEEVAAAREKWSSRTGPWDGPSLLAEYPFE